ncbi:MAG: polysaccharide pyruvyl transferase family protein [Burkholderiales bacterium]
MKMYFYRGRRPNFGDELNGWLWPRLLPGFFDDNDRELFIGIGSTLFDFLPRESRKIVFGAGYGGYTAAPEIDKRWLFYFVRGRLTAAALGLDAHLAVGDAAILVRSCVAPPVPKSYRISFMPHWQSAADGLWAEASRAAGLHYIDPCDTVDNVLTQVQASGTLVAEAMHGAIVADALRVPWIPIRPVQPPNRAKWHDWVSALDVPLHWARVMPSSALELAMSLAGRKRYADRIRVRGQRLRAFAPNAFAELAARSLARAAAREPSLSSDAAIDRAHTRMLEALDRLKTDFADRLSADAGRGLPRDPTVHSRTAAL